MGREYHPLDADAGSTEGRMSMGMTCKQCRNICECEDDAWRNDVSFDPDVSAQYCTGFEPETNADRIRDMSDDELAEWICEGRDCQLPHTCPGYHLCTGVDGKANGLKKWLKQPVEDEL